MPNDEAPKFQWPADCTEVAIVGSVEARGVVTLADGSKLAVRIVAQRAARQHGVFDDQGRPSYLLASANMISCIEAPEELCLPAGLKKAG